MNIITIFEKNKNMKNLLCLLIMSLSFFTFAQEKMVLDKVIIIIDNNNIKVIIPRYIGKLKVKYKKVRGYYSSSSEYINMYGFEEKKILLSGEYIIEVTRDNKKKKTAKFRIN